MVDNMWLVLNKIKFLHVQKCHTSIGKIFQDKSLGRVKVSWETSNRSGYIKKFHLECGQYTPHHHSSSYEELMARSTA